MRIVVEIARNYLESFVIGLLHFVGFGSLLGLPASLRFVGCRLGRLLPDFGQLRRLQTFDLLRILYFVERRGYFGLKRGSF